MGSVFFFQWVDSFRVFVAGTGVAPFRSFIHERASSGQGSKLDAVPYITGYSCLSPEGAYPSQAMAAEITWENEACIKKFIVYVKGNVECNARTYTHAPGLLMRKLKNP